MKARKATSLILAVALLFVAAGLNLAQQGRGKGRIRGTVSDESGKPLVGVKIIAESVEYGTKFESESNKKGNWALGGLGSGLFTITTEFEGYVPIMEEINVSQFLHNNPKLNFVLKSKKEVLASASGIDASLIDEGNQFFSKKKYSEALGKFQEFLDANPNIYQVYINIGNCYKEMEDPEAAISAYQTVLDKTTEEKGSFEGDQNAARAFTGLGQIYMKKNDTEKAMGYFQQAFESFPIDANMAFMIAEILFTQGKASESIVYYDKAITIKNDWADPHRQKGYALLNLADYKMAIESFEKFLELAPDHPQASTIRDLLPQLEKMIKN
jgi:tetratricopeptide (TPR) repeat protein